MATPAPIREFTLKSAAFRRERQESWMELEALLRRVQRSGLTALTTREAIRLATLYRAAMSSLSVARAISLDRNVAEYLESLSARAYFQVYGTKRPIWAVLFEFFARGFPSLVRRHWLPILLTAAFLIGGTVTSFRLILHDPELFYSFVNEDLETRTPLSSTEDLRAVLYGEMEDDSLAEFASFLFTHNSQVSLLAFALGFLGGLPSVLLIFMNGLTIGALAAVYHDRGLSLELWAWLLPHGITELTAICLAGGAGLILAQALAFPGPYRRLESMARKGREAGQIVVGAMLMLSMAGMLEGFFRQMVQSVPVRYSVAAATAVLWLLYFGFAGRRRAP